MVFSVFAIIISILYIILLELSKNTLISFGIGLIATATLLYTYHTHRCKPVVLWLCFFAVLVGNYFLTAPPEKLVPAVAHSNPKTTPVLSLPQGNITGLYSKDEKVAVYAGIPYAAPPTGENRFREPQPAESWEGVRACDHFGPMAMQPRTQLYWIPFIIF
jgi:para-nitrobenzyl esterase